MRTVRSKWRTRMVCWDLGNVSRVFRHMGIRCRLVWWRQNNIRKVARTTTNKLVGLLVVLLFALPWTQHYSTAAHAQIDSMTATNNQLSRNDLKDQIQRPGKHWHSSGNMCRPWTRVFKTCKLTQFDWIQVGSVHVLIPPIGPQFVMTPNCLICIVLLLILNRCGSLLWFAFCQCWHWYGAFHPRV